ncbi:MAG TPA: glycosyltransferase family 2 protein [Candidatus Acidoferrales bacterium]|nr:glycosyltransferase family 2 protein [Candidatus Acidoferrales bacterium]
MSIGASAGVRARIIIVNTNDGEFIRGAIESAQTQIASVETVVVDNQSTDGSPLWIESLPDVKLVRRQRNDGFGAAINTGAEGATAPFLAFLNPDAVASPEWIDEITRWMDATDTDIACTLVAGAGGYYFTRGTWAAWRGAARNQTTVGDRVDWINGCSMVVRSDAFRRLRGFDDSYFLYGDDVDLSLRARRHGMRIGVYEKALVLHEKHGKSTDALGFRKFEIAFESRGRLVALHTPPLMRSLACTIQGLLQPLLFPCTASGKVRLIRAFFRGYARARANIRRE